LVAVTISPDDVDGVARSPQPQRTNFLEHSDRTLGACRGLDDRQEFTLERPVISFRALFQALNDVVGCILDGEVQLEGSILASY
jgi:hypothetical protein